MSHSEQPQNIYDDPEFFAGYSRLARFGDGWTSAGEHEEMVALLPAVQGKAVADLGCGAGQWALHFAEQGARSVLAVDLSDRMLELARRDRAHSRIRYERAALESVDLGEAQFDLVFSSLAFHYVEDFAGLMRRISRSLVAGGVLVFSTEHPIYTASDPKTAGMTGEDGRQYWILDDYAEEGRREYSWFVDGVRKYHRTLGTLLNAVINAGIRIERVVEPMPSPERLAASPGWEFERKRPMFVLVRAMKADS